MNFTILLGALIVLAGVSILLDAVFHIHLPLVRSAIAVLFVFFGVRILLGAWGPAPKEADTTGAVVMSDRRFVPTQAAGRLKYDIVFGRAEIDLTQLPKPRSPLEVEVNSIFASAVVRVDPAWPILVQATAAFGDVRMPDQTVAAFGAATYQPKGQATPPLLRLVVNGVFGGVRIIESPQEHAAPPPQAISAAPR